MSQKLIDLWKSIIPDKDLMWVLFENGTCDVPTEPANDLSKQAVGILKEYSTVQPGTASGDFTVLKLENNLGWVVTCQSDEILTYVASKELDGDVTEVSVGILGRSKRSNDADGLNVIHVHG